MDDKLKLNIDEIIVTNLNVYTSKLVHVKLTNPLDTPITIHFISSNRNDTSYSIEYEPTQDIFGDRFIYLAAATVYHHTILDNILEILDNLNLDYTEEFKSIILEQIETCAVKCESRYGNHVEDFELNGGYDACLAIN